MKVKSRGMSRTQLTIKMFKLLLVLLTVFNSSLLSGSFSVNAFSYLSHKRNRLQKMMLCASQDEEESMSVSKFSNPIMTRSSFVASAMILMLAPQAAKAVTTAQPSSPVRIDSEKVDQISAVTVTPLTEASAATSSFQESISGFFAGASVTTSKTLVKFPLDTATVRLQMPDSTYTIRDLSRLFQGSYNGVTLSLLSNIPAGAIFFAVKDAVKSSLQGSSMSKYVTTTLAVAAAQIPYWAVRNPSEVIKVRQQTGSAGYGDGVSAFEALQRTFVDSSESSSNSTLMAGLKEFYVGYWENILYAYPADVVKFVAYEAITQGRKDISPVEGAQAGAFATAIAQFVTTPLDVVRNRLMTRNNQTDDSDTTESSSNYLQSLNTLAQEEGLSGLFAGATPRVGKAILSGAVQFATYEETKKKIANIMQR